MNVRLSSRRRARPLADVRGFTLVELLVVILLIGTAAIALAALINQREKGYDTAAKTTVKTASTALVTHMLSADTFAVTTADLEAIEPTLADARNLHVSGGAETFEMSEDSASGTTFKLERDAAGDMTRTCSAPGAGLCHASPDAAGNES